MWLYLFIVVAIVLFIYLLLIMPSLRKKTSFHKLEGWLYAHRGLHDNQSNAPENSLAAFLLAVENNYGIELDVQLSKDGVPVIMHDYSLLRACGVARKVSEYTYEELQQFQLFSSEERIPTFQEVLKLVNARVPLIIELKIPFRPERLCKAVAEILSEYPGTYCIESFNPLGLMWYKKHEPKVIRGQLATDFIKEKTEGSKVQYFVLKHLLMNFLARPDFIAYHHIYKKSISFNLCRILYRVKTVAWTIKTQEELEHNRKHFGLFIFESFIPKE